MPYAGRLFPGPPILKRCADERRRRKIGVKNTNRTAARSPAMSRDQDGRQAALIFAVAAAILFGAIFVLRAISF
jgi:hypothetical protein